MRRETVAPHVLSDALRATPDIDRRLAAGAKVAEVACGAGWRSVAIAAAYPYVTVRGVDADDSSIFLARRLAFEHGVADRVTFEVGDPSSPVPGAPFAVVLAVDLAPSAEALAAVRQSLAADGVCIAAGVDPSGAGFASVEVISHPDVRLFRLNVSERSL